MNTNLLITLAGFYALVLLVPVVLVTLFLRPQAWHHLLAFSVGFVIGLIDLHSTEPQFTAVLLLLFGVFLGFARPARAWLWGILLAAWVPVGAFVNLHVQAHPGALLPEGVGSLLAFAFSFAGAYLGAGASKFSSAPRHGP